MHTEKVLLDVIRNLDDTAIIVADQSLLIRYINPFVERFFRCNANDIINKKTMYQIHEEKGVNINRLKKAINIAEKTGKYKFKLKTEEDILDATIIATKDTYNNLDSYILIGKDITSQYQRERLLRLLTETSRSFLESTNWLEKVEEFLEQLKEILKCKRFYLLKETKGNVEIIKQDHGDPPSLPFDKIKDILKKEKIEEIEDNKNRKSFLIIPIQQNGLLWGCICLEKNTENKIPEEFISILKMAADIIQGAIIREKLESLFFRSQKLESLGRLSGGIAHEFNNLFQIILGHTQLAIAKQSADEIKKHLVMILNTVNKGSSLADKLLMFGKKNEINKEIVNINDIISEMRESLIKLTGQRVKIIFELDPKVKNCLGDKLLIEQVIINLILNAKEAIDSEGRIWIKTKNITFKERNLINLPPGEYIELTVKDTGCGMKKEVLEQIFEPFFTTKENGTGLGLSAVYGIVKKLGGEIIVESYPEKGTIFKVYFPEKLDKNETELDKEIKTEPLRPHKKYNILIIDDEKELGESLGQILEFEGHQVLIARSQDEAKLLISKNSQIDLIISDINLPQGDGIELVKQIIKEKPHIKAILMSGYSKEYKNIPPECPLLKKPFNLDELLKLIAKLEHKGKENESPKNNQIKKQ